MKTLMGFTDDEVAELASAAEQAKINNEKLTVVFEDFAKKHGRAKGSVRNFYYEFIRMCSQDEELKNKYFKNLPAVSRPKAFDKDEEKFLIDKILNGKRQNKSVRRVISELSGGDEKLSLRYQNKYRNILKNDPELIDKTATEMGVALPAGPSGADVKVPDIIMKQLKTSINKLVDNISRSVRDENVELKRKADLLEQENRALTEILKRYNAESFSADRIVTQ